MKIAKTYNKNNNIQIGVDVGGTFTDCIILQNGEFSFEKVFSEPASPAAPVLSLIEKAAEKHSSGSMSVVHGSTVATNAVLERKVARTALITTRGFKHTLFIGRQQRPSLYNPHVVKPLPVIAEDNCLEITERIDSQGLEITAFNENEIHQLLKNLKKINPQAITVCFLFSYINNVHEIQMREILQREFQCPISLSSEVYSEIREYERMSTTTLDASLKPLIRNYLNKLLAHPIMKKVSPFYIMQSNGGVTIPENSMEHPINMVLSGPAGGVSACRYLSAQTGVHQIIGLDMGGTSTDVSLLLNGNIMSVRSGKIAGLPLQIPMIDMITIGAGGGSIAWIDEGGLLRVGPQSAGADPGPICYHRGGKELTVSDANLLLGYLPKEHFLGGSYSLDMVAPRKKAKVLSDILSLTIEETLLGIRRIINISMLRALNVVSSGRGADPRDFTLVAFGGAAPLHAAELAREIGIKEVIIPVGAAIFSAFGMLVSPIIQDFVYPLSIVSFNTKENSKDKIKHGFDILMKRAENTFSKWYGVLKSEHKQKKLSMRFKGQEYVLSCQWRNSLKMLIEDFEKEHIKRYGYKLNRDSIEITALELRVIINKEPISFLPFENLQPEISSTKVFEPSQSAWIEVPIYNRETLPAKFKLQGPALIVEDTSTTWLPAKMKANIDQWGNIRIKTVSKTNEN